MEGAYERVLVPYRILVGLIYTHCWPKAYRWMANTLFLCVSGLYYPPDGGPRARTFIGFHCTGGRVAQASTCFVRFLSCAADLQLTPG